MKESSSQSVCTRKEKELQRSCCSSTVLQFEHISTWFDWYLQFFFMILPIQWPTISLCNSASCFLFFCSVTRRQGQAARTVSWAPLSVSESNGATNRAGAHPSIRCRSNQPTPPGTCRSISLALLRSSPSLHCFLHEIPWPPPLLHPGWSKINRAESKASVVRLSSMRN